MGDIYAWDGNAGDFSDPTQWTDLTNPYITGAPGPSDYADFLSGGEVSGTGDVYELYVGSVVGFAADISAGSVYNEGNITISSGSLNSTNLIYNYGTVYVSGGSLNSNDYLYNYGVISVTAGTVDVAAIVSYGNLYAGPGTTIIATGGTNIFPANGDDGIDIEGAGTFDAANVMSAPGFISVGQSATATLTVQDGSTVQARLTSLGAFSGGSGTLTVTGAGTDWEDLGSDGGGFASVGGGGADPGPSTGGNGTLVVSDGATMSELTSADIGVTQDSSGDAIVNDASWTIGTFLGVGDGGTGTLVVSNAGSVIVNGGSTADSSSLSLGSQSGANGTVTVSGQGSRLTTAVGGVVVGGGGDGTLVVEGGATASLNDSDPNYSALTLGSESGSNGTVTISGQGSSLTTYGGGINIGFDGTGYLIITSGATVQATSSDVTVSEAAGLGRNADGTGLLSVSGSGSTFAADAGGLSIGNGGSGYASVEQGATLEVNDTVNGLIIGQFSGASGDLTVTGSGSAVDSTGIIQVGAGGSGTLTILDAGKVSMIGIEPNGDANLQIAYEASSSGTVTVDGTGSLLDAGSGRLSVGVSGGGTLSVAQGGTVLASDDQYTDTEGAIVLGYNLAGTGIATVDGPGSLMQADGLIAVGNAGTGDLTISNGGTVHMTGTEPNGYANVYVAEDPGSTGTVTVEGSGSVLDAGTGRLGVGNSGTGVLSVLQGGTVVAGSSQYSDGEAAFRIGSNATGSGTVVVDGAGSILQADGQISIGDAGSGTLVVSNAGTVQMTGSEPDGTSNVYVGQQTGSLGTLIVEGASALFGAGGGRLTIGSSGTGAVSILQGGTVLASAIEYSDSEPAVRIGTEVGGAGSLTVDGSGSDLAATGALWIGDDGNGTVSVQNGGLITAGVAGDDQDGLVVAAGDGVGSALVAGGTLSVADDAAIGASGQGSLTVSNAGSVVIDGTLDIGSDSSAQGIVTVGGPGTQVQVAGTMIVGDDGTGSLIVNNAGSVIVDGDMQLALGASSYAMVTLDAGYASVQGTVYVGGAGQAVLNIQNGAILDPPDLIIAPTPPPSDAVETFDPYTGFHTNNVQVANINGGGAIDANQIIVGDAGYGALVVAGGDISADDAIVVGDQEGSEGQILLDGMSSSMIGSDLTVGDEGKGLLDVGGGNIVTTDGDATIADGVASYGTVAVNDGNGTSGAQATWTVGGDLTVAGAGMGIITVNQASVAVGGDAIIGDELGSDGTLALSSTFSSLSVNGDVTVGNEGAGVLVDDGELTVTGSLIVVGEESSGQGTFTLNGASFVYGGDLTIGDSGNGLVIIQLGATVTIGGTGISLEPDDGNITIGSVLGATGALDLTGGGSSLTSQTLVVGASGHASVEVSNDASLMTDGDATVGESALGQIQTVTIDTQATWTTNGDLTVGEGGIATALVEDGGQVEVTDNITLGDEAGASGVITVTGTAATTEGSGSASSVLVFGGTLTVGDSGDGELNVVSGAYVSANHGGTGLVVIAADADSTGTVTVDGTGSFLQATSIFIGGNTATAGGGGDLFISDEGAVNVSDAVVYAGSMVTLADGTLISDPLTVSGDALISGSGTISGNVTSNGTIATSAAGTLDITNAIGGDGKITLASDSSLKVGGSLGVGQSIAFDSGTPETLILNTPGTSLSNDLGGLSLGDRIEFGDGMTIIAVSMFNDSTADITFTGPTDLSGTYDLTHIGFAGAAGHFTFGFDNQTGDSYIQVALCFCAGTCIATPEGETPVERLTMGDLVLTQAGKACRVEWIGAGRVLATRGRRSASTPVIVRKGALADNVPHHDLRVTKGHSFYLDGVLIPVEFLVNHRSILWDDRAQEVALYHVELASHDVLLANGAPAESYRDDGNRWLFQNANSEWDQAPKPPCAPILTGGPIVDAVWRRLVERAGPRPGLPLTDDPDVHLLVDGRRVDAVSRHGEAYIFRLPTLPVSARVISRSGSPAELGLVRDLRELGVAVRRIALRQGSRFCVMEAKDVRLVEGFHDFEADNDFRWTGGDAPLPAELFAGFSGPTELVLHIGCTTQYPLFGEPVRSVAA